MDGAPDYYHVFLTLTVPAAPSGQTPVVQQATGLPGRYILASVDIVVPAGVSALAGIAIMYQNETLFPWKQQNTYLFSDDIDERFDIGVVCNAPVALQAINNDTQNAHTFRVRLKVAEWPPVSQAMTAQSTPLVAIS